MIINIGPSATNEEPGEIEEVEPLGDLNASELRFWEHVYVVWTALNNDSERSAAGADAAVHERRLRTIAPQPRGVAK